MARGKLGRWVSPAIVAIAFAALVATALRRLKTPEGPEEPAWDRTVCAFCGMLVSAPSFAAEIRLPDGAVLFFDDPGCLLEHQAKHRLGEHAAWFHHLREARWIAEERVAFVPVAESPMGYGLGAVDAGEPGAIGRDEASARVRARPRERSGR